MFVSFRILKIQCKERNLMQYCQTFLIRSFGVKTGTFAIKNEEKQAGY
jgi:hypothetical protein